jgi:hypothetical protein
MSNYTTQRNEIKTILNSISNIGSVLDWKKSSIDPEIFSQNYLSIDATNTQEIRAWAITRTGVEIDYGPRGGGVGTRYAKLNTIVIFGLMSVDDDRSTWDTFQNLLDSVLDALNPEITLNNSIFCMAEPFQLRLVEQREVGGRILHYCEIEGKTLEQKLANYS